MLLAFKRRSVIRGILICQLGIELMKAGTTILSMNHPGIRELMNGRLTGNSIDYRMGLGTGLLMGFFYGIIVLILLL
jgi:hypothetical protein